MGFFEKLFGGSSDSNDPRPARLRQPQVIGSRSAGNSSYSSKVQAIIQNEKKSLGPGELSTPESLFLIMTQKKRACDVNSDLWLPLVGNVNKEFSRLVSLGFIEEADTFKKFEIKYIIPELKQIAKERGLKVSGKKSDLILRILDCMTEEDARKMVSGFDLFAPTQRGQKAIKAFDERKANEREAVESTAASKLLSGDIEGAGRLVNDFMLKYDPIMWSNADGIVSMDPNKEAINYLLQADYNDLVLPEGVEVNIGVELALSKLFMEKPKDSGKRLLARTGSSIDCPEMMTFLLNPVGGYAKHFDKNKQDHLAELYAHTKMFQASNEAYLIEHIDHDDLNILKGIKILATEPDRDHYKDACPVCLPFNHKKYKKSERDSIPKLPHHWGCRCCFSPWVKSYEEMGL